MQLNQITRRHNHHTVRDALTHEIKDCCEVMRISYAEAATKAGFPNRGRVNFTYDELLAEVINGDKVFVIQAENKVAAMMRIRPFGNDTWRIKDIAVLPEYQRNGYGKELLDFAKREAKKIGMAKIELGMFDDELKLKQWYEKNGFVTVRLIPFSNGPFIIRIMEYTTGV